MDINEIRIGMVDVDSIRVINSRNRDAQKYNEIISSIKTLGLKTPIVVAEREIREGKQYYDLVCGEGRLEAYRKSNEVRIPARIMNVNDEDLLLMSLVENIARRQPNRTAILNEIDRLSKDGYSTTDIAKKTGYTTSYINRLKILIDKGESQLLNVVLAGKIPISVGITIAECSDDNEIQKCINEAYSKGEIKGASLKYVKDTLWKRKNGTRIQHKARISEESLIESCKEDIKRGTTFLRKVQRCENNLAYLKGALMKIMEDECFVDLMITQGIKDIPEQLQK